MKQLFQLIAVLLISISIFYSCKKDDPIDKTKEEEKNITIALLTKDVNNITKNSAESGVTIQVSGTGIIDEVGICWSTNQTPTIQNDFISGSESNEYNNTSKSFDLNISDLNLNTTYYVRSYAKYKDSVYYGNVVNFKTLDNSAVQDEFWTLGSIVNTDSLFVTYDEESKAVLFIDPKGNIGSITFNNGLQAPLEYNVINANDSLISLDASMKVICKKNETVEFWFTVGDSNSKIKTSLENGKIKVEFKEIEMINVTDNTKARSSGSFYVEK